MSSELAPSPIHPGTFAPTKSRKSWKNSRKEFPQHGGKSEKSSKYHGRERTQRTSKNLSISLSKSKHPWTCDASDSSSRCLSVGFWKALSNTETKVAQGFLNPMKIASKGGRPVNSKATQRQSRD